MAEHHHSISMAGSDLSWEDVDRRAHSIGFKERSRYIQYLAEKDIHKSKHDFKQIFLVVMLLLLAIFNMMILLKTW